MLVVATMSLQCNAQTTKTTVDAHQQEMASRPVYKRLLTREQLEAMGINWNKLLLTIPLVEYYMRTHGYQKPSDELFAQRIQEVFGANLNMQSQKPYLPIQGEADYNFASTYYALCGKGIITYNWLLDDLMDVRTNKIVLRPKIFQQILALNNFVMYNDTAAFKFLTQATYSGHEDDYDGMGDPYDGNNILCDLFSII